MFPSHSGEQYLSDEYLPSRSHETHLDLEAVGEDEDEAEGDDGCVEGGDEDDQLGFSRPADHHDDDSEMEQ